ncbi:MAG: tRNA (adenosine(37)-N6)-threonylcarbamoyltransferase complex dimerization subunit type 1 TsaB [Verrucomicrobiia bacterium]
MITLALDTSTDRGAVALLQDGQPPVEIAFSRGGAMASDADQHLFGAIQQALRQQRLAARDIELVAVGIGPGSFTGIRVAIAAAKGLALPCARPIMAVSSFDALALTVLPQTPTECIQMCLLCDARRNEVYSASYDRAGRCGRDCRITALEQLVKAVAAPTWFVSAEMDKYFCDALRKFSNRFVHIAGASLYPSATAVGQLAQKRFHEGTDGSGRRLEPIYLRAADYRKITDD